MSDSDIAIRIFELADEKFPDQKEFAKAIGVSPSIASQWRNGITTSFKSRLPKIAAVLGVTIDYLMTGEREESIVKDDGLTQKERDLIERFRKLPPDRQQYVLGVTQAALDMLHQAL